MIDKDRLIDNAHKLLVKGQLSKAIGEYQKLVDAFPRDFRNRLKLAELLTRERRLEEARPHFEAVAKHFAETGFHLKAVAIYKQIQKNEPGRSETYLRIAELYEQQGLTGNALNEYRGLVAFYERQHLPREALAILRRIAALDPAHLAARCQLIEALLALDEASEAISQFLDLVRVLDGRGEHAGIVRFFEKFPGLVPDDPVHRMPYAKALLLSGQAERALPLLKDLYRQAPDHAALLSLLSDCYAALGRPAEAGAACRPLLELQPDKPGLHERYLRLCIAGNLCHEALIDLEAWRPEFIGAGRLEAFRELTNLLAAAWPDNPRLQALQALEPVGTPAAGGAASAELHMPDITAGPEAASSPALAGNATTLAAPAAELDREPGFASDSPRDLAPQPSPAPAAAAGPPSGPGLELELDLDELQAIAPHHLAADAVAAGSSLSPADPVGPEPALLAMELPEFTDLDFDLKLPEPEPLAAGADSPPAAAEAMYAALETAQSGIPTGAETAGPITPASAAVLDEELQSHYDLGIGYKEMGMFEAAIAEFGKAVAGRFRVVDCLTLMGQCRLATGQAAAAEADFQQALGQPELGEAGRVALRYELGLLYESRGRLLEALESFQGVADFDRFFRETTGKVTALRQALGLDEPGDSPASGPGRHKRISYV